jgi:hypothetical protein
MENRTILTLAILALTISGAGTLYAYSQWSLSHITTGHVTVTPHETTPTGNFTIPVDIYFPDTEQGTSTTLVVHVTSQLNVDATLNAAATDNINGLTVTGSPETLPAGASVDITLTLTAEEDATLGSQPIPVTFTVTA